MSVNWLISRSELSFASAAVCLTVASLAQAQTVPETIHSDARGPSTLCGVAGADAAAIIQSIQTMPSFKDRRSTSPRFELYSSSDETVQWVFTRPSEPAHPAITCRETRQESDGGISMRRSMRCDADRAACDELFLEFQSLDERAKAAMRVER